MPNPEVVLKCVNCGKEHAPESIYVCECGGLLDVSYELGGLEVSRESFDSRSTPSGVWRFKELVHPLATQEQIVSRSEGLTALYHHPTVSEFVGARVRMKHEGENPSGSFKDRGMTVGITEARRLGAKMVACASTGNTSASLASYAAFCGLHCAVFIPEGKIASGKLAQAIAYGSKVLQVKGNFDDALRLVQAASQELGLYLLNSINPWRLEGQKTIVFDIIQQLRWESPDWIAVPAGNLGNTSAFGKALMELRQLGLIEKIPRIAAIQAEGANPFYSMWKTGASKLVAVEKPETIATAIRIGNPVSWQKARRAIEFSKGVVEQVSDQEIMDAKAVVDACGIGCEPASAASIAGAKKLRDAGTIKGDETVVCVLTGNLLKDPDATIGYHAGKLEGQGIRAKRPNIPVQVGASLKEVENALR